MRPTLHEFLTAISKFVVRVIIWSSIRYLSEEVPECDQWIQRNFLKKPVRGFLHWNYPHGQRNTIIIDDSPEKYVCNDKGNCLCLETWTPLGVVDDFLVRTLGQ